MSLLHERWRVRVSLLAAGCLENGERAATLAHLESCDDCRREHTESLAALEALSRDPAHEAEPDLPLAFLVTRVQARLDAALSSRTWRWASTAAALALGLGLAIFVVPRFVTPVVGRLAGPAAPTRPPLQAAMDDDALRRLERNVAREQAVRYLNEAQDVLVTMAAEPRDCDRETGRVDVADESRRSRELLARRALLVELDRDDVAPARGVLEDVEHVLREVASLESCVRAGEVARVRQDVERRRLLMKIRLMSRELQG
jgi:hypothetical protein